ncbi:MAG: hypothetical protein AAB431_02660 [Patescibacteria group bacterium]
MFSFFKNRIHESIALSASLSAALTLQVGWICVLLIERSEHVRKWFTLSEKIGPVSGLYLKMLVLFILFFGVCVLVRRGKDCSHWRAGVQWFFVISLIMYFIFTLPVLSSFVIVAL